MILRYLSQDVAMNKSDITSLIKLNKIHLATKAFTVDETNMNRLSDNKKANEDTIVSVTNNFHVVDNYEEAVTESVQYTLVIKFKNKIYISTDPDLDLLNVEIEKNYTFNVSNREYLGSKSKIEVMRYALSAVYFNFVRELEEPFSRINGLNYHSIIPKDFNDFFDFK